MISWPSTCVVVRQESRLIQTCKAYTAYGPACYLAHPGGCGLHLSNQQSVPACDLQLQKPPSCQEISPFGMHPHAARSRAHLPRVFPSRPPPANPRRTGRRCGFWGRVSERACEGCSRLLPLSGQEQVRLRLREATAPHRKRNPLLARWRVPILKDRHFAVFQMQTSLTHKGPLDRLDRRVRRKP